MNVDRAKILQNHSLESMEKLVLNTRSTLKQLYWLSPSGQLESTSSTQFGRNIERELNELDTQGAVKLRLRKRDAAVVMSLDHFEELVQMKEACARLLEAETTHTIREASANYEALYQRITSPESRTAADDLFECDDEQLAQSYQPGLTESKSTT